MPFPRPAPRDAEALRAALERLGVPSRYYVIEGAPAPDRCILQRVYDHWIVFDLDERGGQHEERRFETEAEACACLYQEMEVELELQAQKRPPGPP